MLPLRSVVKFFINQNMPPEPFLCVRPHVRYSTNALSITPYVGSSSTSQGKASRPISITRYSFQRGIDMNRTCRRALALAMTIMLLSASSAAPVSHAQNPIRNTVSIVQLIARPEKYDRKVVRVMGFLRLEFEGDAIYLHEDDYRHAILKNGLTIVRNAKMEELADRLDLHYVILEGTFDVRSGNMGLNSGTITNITFIGICPTRTSDHRCRR